MCPLSPLNSKASARVGDCGGAEVVEGWPFDFLRSASLWRSDGDFPPRKHCVRRFCRGIVSRA